MLLLPGTLPPLGMSLPLAAKRGVLHLLFLATVKMLFVFMASENWCQCRCFVRVMWCDGNFQTAGLSAPGCGPMTEWGRAVQEMGK